MEDHPYCQLRPPSFNQVTSKMFRNYRVVFLSDATATYDYPDRGFGAMANADVHHATLVILAASTADVISVKDMGSRILSGDRTMAGAGVR